MREGVAKGEGEAKGGMEMKVWVWESEDGGGVNRLCDLDPSYLSRLPEMRHFNMPSMFLTALIKLCPKLIHKSLHNFFVAIHIL